MASPSNRRSPEPDPAFRIRRLRRRRVLIAGVGGLGCPAALHLAAAGVGTLVLVDPDDIELSNLNRQVLHRASSVGASKAASAAGQLRRLYPSIQIELHAERLVGGNVARLISDVDFVIDGTDGVAAKFLINDAAVALGRPFSHAGVLAFHGQTLTVLPGRSACLRCLFPDVPPAGALPTCQEAGIIGPLAGVIGAVQAGEAVKYLLGEDELLADRLLTFDALTRRWRIVTLSRNPRCTCCGDEAWRRREAQTGPL
jgi:molybdopterin/thiamine biosynthesis adenylyltransferase